MTVFDIKTEKKATLAPMAGVADRAFREICIAFGAAMCTSEMVSAKGITFGDRKSESLMEISAQERPAGIQLFGNDPADFQQAMPRALAHHPNFIDINMGCPAPKVTKNGSGSALMKNPQLCGEIVRAAVSAADVPITVKIRKGWDENSINAVEVAQICAEAGAAAITVHGRTRERMYAPPADHAVIRDVCRAVQIPVIGNGDVTDGNAAQKLYDSTGCALVAVGRGALGRPWIFAEINATLNGKAFAEPDAQNRMEIMLMHAAKICEYKGDRIGINEARKHAIWYTKGLRGGAGWRRALSEITDLDALRRIADEIVAANR